ncbi:uncharacterized protein J7T54_003411 [Emericellopsis cladophorae]|uniref:Cupin-like domain-containing protein n=1 Tax=Emericellopsis cladophorae TaxID=2686198 RepID=A0A9P9Y1W7_9HYPO|nr:uncharacterized protein J7T54_003411 [Emericellopsis cladophorae]KAI6781992.1 hypothetical protein J7T54_003411 [Emericellopsis cladophorae]
MKFADTNKTNSSSIASKRSVERLYYPNEPHFFRFFVKKPQRRAPLINRGYWLRLRAIDVIISDGSLFVDIDYPHLMRKKRAIVLQTPQLRDLLGTGVTISKDDNDPVLLESAKYCQLACDLRELEALRRTLDSILLLKDAEVLFVAEVSITYMDTASADALIKWASGIGQDHPFAKTMLRHFEKLNTPIKSVQQYPTVDSQRERFKDRGWAQVDIWDLWEAWSSSVFMTSAERMALDQVEPFDEWEELMLFGRHYSVLHAQASSTGVEDTAMEKQAPARSVNKQTRDGFFKGLYCGGLRPDGTLNLDRYTWELDIAKEVVVAHECSDDTEKMDFNSKNFRYVTDQFKKIIEKIQSGGRLYIRSLSTDNPTDQPANLENDFPSLAEDFTLPEELAFVKENLFSSILRISGRVNMWLHYDVMANVYAQVHGSKPTPTSDLSVAVNIFFRDLQDGYSTGRDVYGNRDLAGYEKGRQEVAKIAKSFGQLPADIRRFYLDRLADELRQAAGGDGL